MRNRFARPGPRRPAVLVATATLALALAACSDDGGGSSADASSVAASASAAAPTPTGPRELATPLRLLPVTGVKPGACPSGAPAGSYTEETTRSCLQVDVNGGMTVTRVSSASAALNTTGSGGWYVNVTFLNDDAKRFAHLTGQLATRPSPQNQLAMVQGNLLLFAPLIQDAIPGGQVQIAGNFTRDQAESLARSLGAPEPAPHTGPPVTLPPEFH